ncbi:MAG: laminin G domain-containing protein [Prevotella sp.]|nr:laminin G domain-containing protein [Prevotella sp.]
MKTNRLIRMLAAAMMLCMANTMSVLAYNSNWKYSTEAKDDGQQSDGGNYTFRYQSDDTKGNFMGFKTYYMFDASKCMFKWNWDIKVNYGNVDDSNTTKVYVTLEFEDGSRSNIAEATFVGYQEPIVVHTSNYRPLNFKKVSNTGEFKYMFTLEYQPTLYDLQDGVKRIYIQCRTTWKGGNEVRNFQYERDLDISSFKNMVPSYSCELDGEGNYKFNVSGTPSFNGNAYFVEKYFKGKVSYGSSIFPNETMRYKLTEETRTGGEDNAANYTVTVPVKSYTVPVRISQLDYTVSARCLQTLDYTLPTATGDAYNEGILFKPFTRVDKMTVEFDKWKKKNVIQWTRNQQVDDYVGRNKVSVECRTDGTWYVLRYEKGASPSDYETIKTLRGSTTNLKVEDADISYDKEYVYRVVFLPDLLADNYQDRLTNLPGEGTTHTVYDLWEEAMVSTLMEVPIKLAQDRSDDTGIHLTWDYNVQTSGCEWRIDKHRLGETTWTTLTTLPVDTRQSTASYLEEGGSVCDLFVYRVMTKINDKELYSDTLVCNLPAGAYISEVTASTGTETNSVIVKWKVARPGDDDIKFRILRRPIGSDEWTLLDDTQHGHASEYTYIDSRVMAGSYYEYSIEAYGAKCDEQLVQTDRRVAPGFSQARGTITGHISYGTGTAVAGARVNLVKSSADESTDQPQFLSRYIDGEGKGLQWTVAEGKYPSALNGQSALTLQLWARPNTTNDTLPRMQSLCNLSSALELGINRADDGTHHLYAIDKSAGGQTVKEFSNLTFASGDFTHIAASYARGKWIFYVGSDSLKCDSMTVASTEWDARIRVEDTPTLGLGGSSYTKGAAYTGYVDDIRLWNRTLTQKEINTNYTRILGGTENGLLLYWPLDEGLGVKDYVFDVAYIDGQYQLNHPTVGVNALPSAIVPSARLLGLYGLTDSEGDYIIRGIPFQQGGTNYKLAPELGIHEFSPNTRSMFISPTSLTANNIDFEDVSSFPMSGYVYYAGTNIPAEGIMFYVDGDLLSGGGEIKQTDSNGYYEISVPIGKHYVEAKLEGHTMVDGGRFPTKGTFDFNQRMQYNFADSTLVNFVGRVGGGLRNDTLAVGFGASNNNIGVATIMLKLNNESFSFNCQSDYISDATEQRPWESDTTSINSHAWTGIGSDSKYIYIKTDSLTGEFSAKLPPLKYITKSIRVDNNPDVEFTSLPEIDLTAVQSQYTDSIMGDNGKIKRYKYGKKMIRTHFAEPQIDVVQLPLADGGNAYGEQEIRDYPINAEETVDISNIWTQAADGSVSYTYGYPIFAQLNNYKFRLHGYETYTNYDSGKAVVETIPLNDQKLTIGNEMSDNQAVVNRIDEGTETDLQVGDIVQLKSDEVLLDAEGYASISWKAGLPNIVAPYTRQFHVSFERADRNYALTPVEGVVLGSLPMGNNFVTKGPDVPLMILRDPPGAKSKTTWKTGHVRTKTRTRSTGWIDDTKLTFENIFGTNISAASGVGYALITVHDITSISHQVINYTHNLGQTHEQTWSVTNTESVSTSSDSFHVGSKGDVFIGVSKNILMGDCRKVGFFRDGNGFRLDMRDSKCLSDSVRTTFMYSTYELETVTIPKWEELRDSMFTRKATQAECEAYQPGPNENVYLTWEDKTAKDYGKEGHYVWKTGSNVTAQNEVHWYNQQIDAWRRLLAQNERDKVLAIEDVMNRHWRKNISFDGGTGYSYSTRRDTTEVWKDFYSGTSTFTIDYSQVLRIKAGGSFGTNVTISENTGVKWDNSGSDYDDNTKDYAEFDYEFNDGNPDTQFSVDIYQSPAGFSDIFRLFGGQSYNPYEPEEKTQYYEEGKHTLSNGTVQMEQPYLGISIGGQNAAKEANINDIPSGQEANLTLHCSNMANVHQGLDFMYDLVVVEQTNTNGLQILMDGVPINGRSIRIPQGETVTKQITIRQTDQSILSYEGIKLRFCSRYQAPVIYDEVTLNAHFIPSSSPIDLVVSEPVLNIETLSLNEGKLEMKLANFNRQYKNLKYVGLQYRYEGNTQWNTIHTYFLNKRDSVEDYTQLPEGSSVLFTYDMSDDNFFPQGNYTFRAFTSTPYGTSPDDAATVYSQEVSVVKDNVRPQNITTPAPANGILRYGDDIAIEFNEDIVPGYVSDKNIIVTAKLNNQPVNHDVALELLPYGSSYNTVNPIFLRGHFSMDFWIKWTQDGAIMRLGKSQMMMRMSINENGQLCLALMGTDYVSNATLPRDTWTYIAVSYNADDMTFSALAQYDDVSVQLFEHEPVTFSAETNINYADDNHLYLGCGIAAAIHDLALYSIYRDVHEAAATRYVSKDQYVYGLLNYWPMNEGHGTTAADMRHTHNFQVAARWLLANTNYSYYMERDDELAVDISRINTSAGDSYAIELWATSYSDNANSVLFETGTKPSNKLCLHYDNEMNLVLDYGSKSQVVASYADFPASETWHHLALNVVRGQAASFYYNGQRTAVIAELDVPMLEGATMKVGTGHYGRIDELRIWHATLTESRLLANMYNNIDTTDVYSRGLVAYYPFEKLQTVDGVPTYVGTLEDMAPATNLTPLNSQLSPLNSLVPYGPPLKKAPVESRLIAKPVASDRKIVVKLQEGSGIKARDIEGTTLNITVDKVFDTHGNPSLPIRWTSYVQLNTLKWTRDSVNIIKPYGDDYTFDVDIENRSGNTEYYTLYNMPQWLTLVDSERTDDVEPLKTKTLRFRVNPLTAVGNYDVTIGLQGNNEILEPLRIVMKIRSEQPSWSVDPTAYENSMSLVGQIYFGGYLVNNSESLLAAFIGNECRGVASPKQVRGAAYVAMSIYGTAQQTVNGQPADLDKGQPITFRIWDAATGTTYSNVNITLPSSPDTQQPTPVITDTLAFDPAMNYGTFDHPLIFTKSNRVEQPLDIRSGWNWLSLGVEPASVKTSVVFKDIVSWNAQLKDQGTGVAYSRGSYWTGSLKEIHANTMYKLLLARLDNSQELPAPLIVNGEPVKLSDTPVTLRKGWNWIAYLPLATMPIDEALAGANPQRGDQLKSQTGFAYYGPYGWEGNLEALESGKGYLYLSTDDAEEKQFVYPASTPRTTDSNLAPSHPRTSAPSKEETRTSAFAPVPPTDYPDNMAIVIMLSDGGQPVTTSEVAAFIDGECRGAAFATDDLYYLLVAGEGSGQPMEIKAVIDGSVRTVCTSLTYSSDASIGTPWEPFVIDIGNATNLSTLNSHLEDGIWYTLQGIRYGTDKPKQPGVYIYNGQKTVVRKNRQ